MSTAASVSSVAYRPTHGAASIWRNDEILIMNYTKDFKRLADMLQAIHEDHYSSNSVSRAELLTRENFKEEKRYSAVDQRRGLFSLSSIDANFLRIQYSNSLRLSSISCRRIFVLHLPVLVNRSFSMFATVYFELFDDLPLS